MKKNSFLRLFGWFALAHFVAFAPSITRAAEINLDEIVSPDQVSKLIGTITERRGPTEMRGENDDQDHLVSHVFYEAAEASLGVTVLSFDSASAAAKKLTKDYLKKAVNWDDVTLVDEGGLGDRAFWSTSTDGNAAVVVLKGRHVLTLTYISVTDRPASGESHHAALRAVAQAGLSKLKG
jgi:hypothetical protein